MTSVKVFSQEATWNKNYCLKSESPGERTEDRKIGRMWRHGYFLLSNGCIITKKEKKKKISPIHDLRLWKQ